MTKFESPYASRDWTTTSRNILAIVVGLASLPVLLSVGSMMTYSWGVPAPPAVGPFDNPMARDSYMNNLTAVELLSSLMVNQASILNSSLMASSIYGSRSLRPGWILGGVGMVYTILNVWLIPGQPVWLIALNLTLFLPFSLGISWCVLRVKNFLA